MGIRRALPSEESSSRPEGARALRFLGLLGDLRRGDLRDAQGEQHADDGAAARYGITMSGLESTTMLDVNDKAPDIKLEDENGKEVSLKDFKGKTVVLYFYPRADTPGCTKEACEFRDTYKQMQKTGAVLLGASPDTPKAQKKFQEKFHLPFTLLADADKKLCNAFGVIQEKNMYGKKVMGVARTTFIIGPDGKIKHVFHKVKPEGHSEEVLAYLKQAA